MSNIGEIETFTQFIFLTILYTAVRLQKYVCVNIKHNKTNGICNRIAKFDCEEMYLMA